MSKNDLYAIIKILLIQVENKYNSDISNEEKTIFFACKCLLEDYEYKEYVEKIMLAKKIPLKNKDTPFTKLINLLNILTSATFVFENFPNQKNYAKDIFAYIYLTHKSQNKND